MRIYCFSEEDARLDAVKEIVRSSTKNVSVGFDYDKVRWYVEIEDFSEEERETYWKWEDAQRLKAKSTKE